MVDQPFWSRIKNARLFRVLVIYGAASWVILQIVGLFIETMDLPRWTMPWTLVLLVLGLIITLGTAWIQSHPLMPAREAADEVPEDWELDVGEIKEAVSEGRLPHLNWARVIAGGAFAFAMLFGLAGLYVVIQDRGESFAPEPALAEAVAPGIAVLPFTVQGEGLDVLKEGMVSLLSTGLDGASGLRTIAPGTVFARWREQVQNEEIPELETAIDVARRTGAHYALIGSAVAVGSNVRLAADAYDVQTGERLGQGTVEGSPEDVLPLVDRLGVEVLRVILQRGEEDLPEIDMASLTTRSPEALRAYLEGLAFVRRDADMEAVEAFQRAVEADSMFALAHYQLAESYWGVPSFSRPELRTRHLERATRLSDRLPERDRVLIRAKLALDREVMDEVEILRGLVKDYPDEAQAWDALGETYFHVPGTLATADEMMDAFSRSAALDPNNLIYKGHLIEFAFGYAGDVSLAARLVEEFERIDPGGLRSRIGLTAFQLAFGDSTTRARAVANLDTLDTEALHTLSDLLLHPDYSEAQEVVATESALRGDETVRGGASAFRFVIHALWGGRLQDALPHLEEPSVPAADRAEVLYFASAIGLPVPDDMMIGMTAPEGIADSTGSLEVLVRGAFGADRDRWSDHAAAVETLRSQSNLALSDDDSLQARRQGALADGLEGYGVWLRGRPEEALPLLERGQPESRIVRWWLGELYLELGQWAKARRIFDSYSFFSRASFYGTPFSTLVPFSTLPMSQLRLGRIHEEQGHPDEARLAYEYFIEHWKDADPEFQPIVEEARLAVIRLTSEGTE
jgi:tetratricopeptide (TPR) repeat protein